MFDASAYLPPLAVTCLATLSYFLLYTMYSKQEKTLVPALLVKVLTFSEGLEHTLIETNKVGANGALFSRAWSARSTLTFSVCP